MKKETKTALKIPLGSCSRKIFAHRGDGSKIFQGNIMLNDEGHVWLSDDHVRPDSASQSQFWSCLWKACSLFTRTLRQRACPHFDVSGVVWRSGSSRRLWLHALWCSWWQGIFVRWNAFAIVLWNHCSLFMAPLNSSSNVSALLIDGCILKKTKTNIPSKARHLVAPNEKVKSVRR